MRQVFFVLSVVFLMLACAEEKPVVPTEKLTDFVNPFLGTDGPGNTYPGATVPYGMVQLSPDIGIPGWDRIAGYFYRDSIISGFSHTHLSGTGAGDLYDILVMPTNSRSRKRIEANNYKPFSSFSHDREAASPGYYTVDLLDYGIKAELTATARTGVHRYIFPKDSLSQIHIDLGYALNWDRATDTYFKITDSTTVVGYRMSTGWAKDQRIYFAIKLSKPFQNYQLYNNDTAVSGREIKAVNTKLVLDFATSEQDTIILKTGLSTASIAGAEKSLSVEAPHFGFDTYRHRADSIWENQLNKIKATFPTKEQKAVFYTMLYQSMLAPTLLSDHNQEYKGANDTTMTATGYDRYDTFSLWDTYRAAHPLYTILHPDKVGDFINSMLAHYRETGLLPVWSMQGNETNMMIGYHAVPVVVDAYFKGIGGFDANLAYEACKASAMDNNRGIDRYKALGYVPINEEENEDWSVSKTLEYAYDDWCVAQFAQALGKKDDYAYFLDRSENWRNLYDSQSSFMRPKYANGEFIADFVPKEYSPYFCESNGWHYFWSVPQNIEGLIESVGGGERFEQKLDSMFSFDPLPTDKLPIFSTGMIGQYAHGNEPSHHVGYLYNYIDRPHKTQKTIREVLATQYKNTPDGHCGNEDCGQMSSWYIFSALGFYPVNPAQGVYQFGSPIVHEAEIKLENGKTFIVKALNNSENNIYIKRTTLNNKEINRNYISHSEIIKGGELVFTMTDTPSINNKNKNALSGKIYE